MENIINEDSFWREVNTERLFSSTELLQQLVPYLTESEQKNKILNLIKLLDTKKKCIEDIFTYTDLTHEQLLSVERVNSLNILSSNLDTLGVEEAPITYVDIKPAKSELEKYELDLNKLNKQIEVAVSLISPLSPSSISTYNALLAVKEILEKTPNQVLIDSIPGLWTETARMEIKDRQLKCDMLKNNEKEFVLGPVENDLKSDKPKQFREFESHFLLFND
jgi:hypothetical protein